MAETVIRNCLLALMLVLTLNSCTLTTDDWRSIAERSGLRDQARVLVDEKLASIGGVDGIRSIEELSDLFIALGRLLESIWGEDEDEVSSDKRLVKYSNDYQARAIVDFEQGYLRIETVAEDAPLDKLKQATVLATLTPRNLSLEDIFSDSEPALGAEPFLYGQVLDEDGEAIRYMWRAERFADYLLERHVQIRRVNGQRIYSVQTALVADHTHLRSLQYADSVLRYARQYGIAADLIYAVIEIESAFNPYAISHANALGLMQIVPSTAGRDVFERIKRLPGEPTRQQLFEPDFNIDIGTAYLHLLDDAYLNRISHPQSRLYASISAYNGGAGNVFRTFASDREQAITQINRMTPQQVYQQLTRAHPFAETRRYLEKVVQARSTYQ